MVETNAGTAILVGGEAKNISCNGTILYKDDEKN